MTRAQQRRGGETLEMNSERRTRIPNWNPPFVLDAATLPIDSSICNFENERAGSVANSVKQTLRLPQDMAELCNLKKHEMFLSLKRDLALVQFCIILLLFFNSHFLYACKFSSHSSSTCHRGMGWPGPLWKERRGVQALCCLKGSGPNRQKVEGRSPLAIWVRQSLEKCWGLN